MALRDFLESIAWVERCCRSCPDMYLLSSETSQIHNWSPRHASCVELHDATLDCPLRNTHEIVCHGDASPCNCVFVDGMPTAFIDFDDAHAGSRLDDLGYAAWLWIDIGNDDLSVDHQGQRMADFFLGVWPGHRWGHSFDHCRAASACRANGFGQCSRLVRQLSSIG